VRKEKIRTLPTIKGMVPDLADLPAGCRFADRCPKVEPRCHEEEPALEDTEGGGRVACFRPN
jgi:oligopeptide/dipeptide ABC transporter ATP-binding protein